MPDECIANFHWLKTGDEAFAAMLDAIEAAVHSVRLETYIFADSPLGAQFRAALVRACQRQVNVRVLVDAIGSLGLSASFWEPLTAARGEFRWFNPLNLARLAYRDHRKVLVCDARVAFVGGFNIAPEYQGDGLARGWRDLGLQVCGPLAQALAESFDRQFARAQFQHRPFTRWLKPPFPEQTSTPEGDLLLSGGGRSRNLIKRALLADLRQCTSAMIMSAYFLPTWRLRRQLMRLTRHGHRVQLILAGKSDVVLSQLASQRLYMPLLRAGVEIYEYQPQVLHAKLFIINHAVYVGSANLDARSLNINYELLLRLPNPRLVAEAEAIFAGDLRHCLRVDPISWRASRGVWRKLKERWAYFILVHVDQYIARRQLRWLK
jgi:cardiolipin synthase